MLTTAHLYRQVLLNLLVYLGTYIREVGRSIFTHLHRPAMLNLALLSVLVGVATSAPQSRIIPEANTYGTQATAHFIHQRFKTI